VVFCCSVGPFICNTTISEISGSDDMQTQNTALFLHVAKAGGRNVYSTSMVATAVGPCWSKVT